MTLVVGDPVIFDFDKPMTPEKRAEAVLILGLPMVEAMEAAPKSNGSQVFAVHVSDEPFRRSTPTEWP